MEGYYVLVNHKADTQFIKELTRLFNINENIMRSMTIANA
jgi:ribosomal protein S6